MAADGFRIECGGKTWVVGRPTVDAEKALTAAVKQAAWAETQALKGDVPAAYAESAADYFRAVRAGQYKRGGAEWLAGLNSPDGDTLFLLALLVEHQPAATLADARELAAADPDSVAAALAVQVPDFFDLMAGLPDTPPALRSHFRTAAARAKTPTPPTG